MNPSRKLIVQAICKAARCRARQKYRWRINEQENTTGQTSWTERKYYELDSRKLAINLKSLVTLNSARRDPVFKVDVRATVSGLGHEEADLTFRVNSPPFIAQAGRGCQLEPKEGTAIATTFKVTCLGWEDEDGPPSFEFRHRTAKGNTVIQFGSPHNLTTKLPIGDPMKNYSVELHIIVTDPLGASAETAVSAKVLIDPIGMLSFSEPLVTNTT